MKIFSYSEHRPDRKTEAAKKVIRSVLDNARCLSETSWGVSIVNKINAQHAFLIIEGMREGQYIIFRSDLFVDKARRIEIFGSEIKRDSLVDIVFGKSESSVGQAFIRINEITQAELAQIAEESHFQSWSLTMDEVKLLFKKIDKDSSQQHMRFNVAGGSKSKASGMQESQNCVSWCERVLKELNPDKFKLATEWCPIKIPSHRVQTAIENNM